MRPARLARPLLTVAVAAALGRAFTGPAAAERLVLSLSTNLVAINSSYTGSELVAFGVIERDAQSVARPGGYEAVVTVRGPRQSVTLRRKDALGPVWVNRAQQKYAAIPTFLGVFASHPIGDLANLALRRKLRIGLDAIVDSPEFTFDRGEVDEPFRRALVRLKRRDRLYVESNRGVSFVTPAIFRTALPLPGSAPTGNYDVEALILADGVVVGREQASFAVEKAGVEAQLTTLARDRSSLYGLAIAALALAFGWLASVIFRRD